MSRCLCLFIREGFGTPADKMEDQVDEDVKHRRFDRLKALADGQLGEINARYVGSEQVVIVEGFSKSNSDKLSRAYGVE